MAERALYLYGVAAAAAAEELPVGAAALEAGFPLELVHSGALVALVSRVEPGELGRRVAAAQAGDLAALEPLLRGHEQLLAREWGAKGLLARERLAAFLAAAVDGGETEAGPGQAYLARKRRERELAQRLRQEAAALAESTHARLAARARAAVRNPPQPPELSGYREEMILNGAYLVERRHEQALAELAAALGRSLAERGLRLELTGPWPPFSFAAGAPGPAG